jgi:energy-coupling factor transporter ATP-binding protein EcfA2
MPEQAFDDLPTLAQHLRDELGKPKRKFVLLYAHNGTGKTRLCGAFKDLGKASTGDGTRTGDTLYFSAFTEDLFSWNNDLDHDRNRVLTLNGKSRFFDGLRELEMEVKIGQLLDRYSTFNFYIDYEKWTVTFFHERETDGSPIPIKISRSEESIFIWCFFLAILQLALDDSPTYDWVRYVYIDDPVSSVDEHNAIVVGNHLVQMYREAKRHIPTVISTHHALFFNVLHYEIKNHLRGSTQYVLKRDKHTGGYRLDEQKGDTPQFYHVSALADLWELAKGEKISTYHFNVLRSILEKTAFFHGYAHFGSCIKKDAHDAEGILLQRFVDILSHGKYSMYEAVEMQDETREYFRAILKGFVERFPFNPALLPKEVE